MTRELERYAWEHLRAEGSAVGVPDAIIALASAASRKDAEKAYWKIDNTVIVQGRLFESALPTVTCSLVVLPRCTDWARPRILELLYQISAGQPDKSELRLGNVNLRHDCLRELNYGTALYFDLLENSENEDEKIMCVDILGECCEFDYSYRKRLVWWLKRLLNENVSQSSKKLIHNWIQEL